MYKKDLSYHDIPFTPETPEDDFFTYGVISNLCAKCESNKNKTIRIRTVGILENNNGRFFITEMHAKHKSILDTRQSIQVSVAHMSKSVRCARMPYPVQLFGRLKWCSYPVIFAQIVQPLSASVAVLLHETMARTSTLVSTSPSDDSHEDYDQFDQDMPLG